jgi:hypothetical protein
MLQISGDVRLPSQRVDGHWEKTDRLVHMLVKLGKRLDIGLLDPQPSLSLFPLLPPARIQLETLHLLLEPARLTPTDLSARLQFPQAFRSVLQPR